LPDSMYLNPLSSMTGTFIAWKLVFKDDEQK